jgi:superfamily II RNA helicase
LDEARALIEKSFGNYVGSEVMVAAKQELSRLQKDVEQLEKECAVDSDSLEGRLTPGEIQEFLYLKDRSTVPSSFSP